MKWMRAALILSFALCSCKQPLANNSINHNQVGFSPAGKWSVCSSKDKQGSISYNVCPVITINKNGTGLVTTANKYNTTFRWTLNDHILNIENDATDSARFLNSGNYKIIKTASRELIIEDQTIGRQYFFGN